MCSNKQVEEYLENNWRKIPIKVLANKVGLTQLELCKFLREKNISTEVKAIELDYIIRSIDSIPIKQIKENLGMTDTQFSQIMQKKVGRSQLKSAENLTLKEVLKKARWLIEEKLKLDIDDFLPRELRTSHFIDNSMSNCLEYADIKKEKTMFIKILRQLHL